MLATDTLHEALFLLFKREWALAWRVPIWTLKGPAVVKEKLAALVTDDDVALFPCNPELQAFAEREALRGREIVLATAADRAIAEKVSKRFSFISKVIASDGRTNMSGAPRPRNCANSIRRASFTLGIRRPTFMSGGNHRGRSWRERPPVWPRKPPP